MDFLKVTGLTKVYGEKDKRKLILKSVSFQVDSPFTLAIMGESGAGKTTLLRILSGIDTNYVGKITYGTCNESPDTIRAEQISYIPQDSDLISFLTVYENILIGQTSKKAKRILDEEVKKTAAIFGIDDILDSFPDTISGGERQRCACARAMIKNPSLLLADEPTSSLDKENSDIVMAKLRELKSLGKMIIFTTHNLTLALNADAVIYLEEGIIKTHLRKNDYASLEEYKTAVIRNAFLGSGVQQ